MQKNQMPTNDLIDFIASASREFASEYERIQKRSSEDPGTAGDQGENNWAELLRDWLPSTFHVETKGRIMSHDGRTSPQVDVVVLRSEYPKGLLNNKIYLAGGVAAAFECKLTLTAGDIRKTMENAVKIRRLLPPRNGSPYKELNSSIIYGLLAHSHSWKRKQSKPLANIEKHLHETDQLYVSHPREMLDFVCVHDLATWVAAKTTHIGPAQIEEWSKEMSSVYEENGSSRTSYVESSHRTPNQATSYSPIGAMLTWLLSKLAWEHSGIRPIAEYLRKSDLAGSGAGCGRLWNSSIYSDGIRDRVIKGHVKNQLWWNEWSVFFL